MQAQSPSPTCARDRILDAADKLVCLEGAGNLTLDAVAHAAGVSKGGLLYHFPNKDALLAAMVERHIDQLDLRCAEERQSLPEHANSSDIKSWILGVLQPHPMRAEAGAALFAAAAHNPALLEGIRRRYAEHVARLARATTRFPLAAVIMLAVDGLMLDELYRITPYTVDQREQIVQQLLNLADEAFGQPTVPPAAKGDME